MMPAYRSEAEAEVRNAVIERLRSIRPHARIIHEINDGGSNRFDLMAVSPEEIISCEIKSSKDTLDLLPAQMTAMLAMSHHVIVAIHEKHRDEYDKLANWRPRLWVYPEVKDDWRLAWRSPHETTQTAAPIRALRAVWKDELLQICAAHRISANSRSRCEDMRRDLVWHLSGKELTRAICAAFRQRDCIEADPPDTSPKATP